ncbi:hypothetical protein [Kordia sp.]|uniref:hypothetical protein n=1 Tax=Kordia sp. TaxID=1965332 RepID=UPI003D296EFE
MYIDGIVHFNEVDFEVNDQDFYTFLMYLGKPFTGTLKEENMTTEFKNGNAHGEAFEYNKEGILIYYAVFENGDYVLWKNWYPNGQPKEDSELGRIWNEDGILVKDNGHWLHRSNGAPKTQGNLYVNELIYLAPNGEIAAKEVKTDSKPPYVYFDNVLFEWYNEILKNPCPELHAELSNTNSYTRFIWGWVWTIYQKQPKKAMTILQDIATHENKEIAKEACEMLNDLKNKTHLEYIKARWL